jgi:hypothetical protein
MTKRLLIIIPFALIGLGILAVLALPSFVATRASRPAIEALASTITSQTVTINGPLTLDLLPEPRLVAQNISIAGSNGSIIQAGSLTLRIALPALLHGRLSAKTLILDQPAITLPWPPAGSTGLAPPRWLARLHGEVQNGSLSIGGLTVSGINADIVTNPGGALAVSGSGICNGQSFTAKINLAATDATGTAPLTITASSGSVQLALNGALTGASAFGGTLALTGPSLTGSAAITATPDGITASAIQITNGAASLSGSAAANASPAGADINLAGQGFDLGALAALLQPLPGLPVSLTLTVNNVTLSGLAIPALALSADFSQAGGIIHQLTASLPGNGLLTANGTLHSDGTLAGTAHLTTTGLDGLLGPLPAGWTNASLSASLAGTLTRLQLNHLTGNLGPSNVAGSLTLSAGHAYGALHFDSLALTPWLAWAGTHQAQSMYLGGEITADSATIGTIPLTHLLLDGDHDHGLTLRRASAALYGGLAAGSVSLDAGGNITAINGFLSLPSAAPLGPLLPAGWQPPPALLVPPLNIAITGHGPPGALAASATATLGDFSVTADPVIDLTHMALAGGLTLRHPSAINAMTIFGLNRGLAWPGAGSLSLRAYLTASPTEISLPDFVLSFGASTATGTLSLNNNTLSGDIAADTLALPPFSTGLSLGLMHLTLPPGKINFAASQVLYAGTPFFGPSRATLTIADDNLTVNLTSAAFDGGSLTGTASLATSPDHPPALAGSGTLTGLDLSQVTLRQPFPYTLSSGTMNGQATLSASGYTEAAWAATLAGTASATITKASFNGFSLAGIAAAARDLKNPNRPKNLRTALTSGTTPNVNLSLAGALTSGNATLTTASLTSPDGAATATGSINLPSQNLVLKLALTPVLTPPLMMNVLTLGNWAAPREIARLRAGLQWLPGK